MQSSFSPAPTRSSGALFFLTAAGMLTRVMGFFYRIFLSRSIGAEQVGIYQMIFSVYGVLCAASSIRHPDSHLPAHRCRSVQWSRLPDSCAAAAHCPASGFSWKCGASGPSPVPCRNTAGRATVCTASAGSGLLRSLKQHPRLHQRLLLWAHAGRRTVPVPAGGTECPDAVYFHGLENQPAGRGLRCRCPPPCGRWGPESWLRCSSVSRQWG